MARGMSPRSSSPSPPTMVCVLPAPACVRARKHMHECGGACVASATTVKTSQASEPSHACVPTRLAVRENAHALPSQRAQNE